ncbi:MAG TPA: hypothetical protein VIR58_05950 [Acidimicrobiales bacterium]
MARLAAGSSGSADGSDDVATTTDAAGDAPPLTPRSRLGSALLGIGIGAGVGVACIAIAFSIIAIPLYVLASTEPGSGLDRTLVRRGLFQVALPLGVVAGTVAGIVVGVWYSRGGRLPTDRTPLYEQ